MMMRTNDFYMVLPSNASPESQPNNTAGNFIVNWENPVDLDPDSKWHVALTELSYVYHPSTISTNYSIKYKIIHLDEQYRVPQKLYYDPQAPNGVGHQLLVGGGGGDPQLNTGETPLDTWIPKLRRNPMKANEMFFISKRAFSIAFSDDDLEKIKPIPKQSPVSATARTSNGFWYIPTELTQEQCTILLQQNKEIKFMSKVGKYSELDFDISFAKDRDFQNPEDFVKYLAENCSSIFKDVKYVTETNRIALTFKPRVVEIELRGGLHFAMGFTSAIFRVADVEILKNLKYDTPLTTIVSKQPPQLHRGVVNMYIYASICQPIYVGHSLVPLLKNVFIDASDDDKQLGHARNSIIYNPMYIPIASTSFNSIEINIRNDAGKIVTFPTGAKTILTLRFKKM